MRFLRQHRTKPALRALHASCLHIFRHLAQVLLGGRQPAGVDLVQSDEKSDGAICAQALCGVALNNSPLVNLYIPSASSPAILAGEFFIQRFYLGLPFLSNRLCSPTSVRIIEAVSRTICKVLIPTQIKAQVSSSKFFTMPAIPPAAPIIAAGIMKIKLYLTYIHCAVFQVSSFFSAIEV